MNRRISCLLISGLLLLCLIGVVAGGPFFFLH